MVELFTTNRRGTAMMSGKVPFVGLTTSNSWTALIQTDCFTGLVLCCEALKHRDASLQTGICARCTPETTIPQSSQTFLKWAAGSCTAAVQGHFLLYHQFATLLVLQSYPFAEHWLSNACNVFDDKFGPAAVPDEHNARTGADMIWLPGAVALLLCSLCVQVLECNFRLAGSEHVEKHMPDLKTSKLSFMSAWSRLSCSSTSSSSKPQGHVMDIAACPSGISYSFSSEWPT